MEQNDRICTTVGPKYTKENIVSHICKQDYDMAEIK
jgi:hypothetical protein